MIRLLFYIAIIGVSVWLGLKIADSSGYVLISYQHIAIETSLWIAAGAVLVAFGLTYFLLRAVSSLFSLTTVISRWRQTRRRRKAQQLTQKGLKDLAEGHWRRAEKSLLRAAGDTDSPLINYLAAANAAQGEGNLDARDEYLHKALQSTEHSEVAVGLTQAQLQYDNQQLEQALATLEHLNRIVPSNKHVMDLLQRVYVQLEDWDSVRAFLPILRKYKVLDQSALLVLEAQSHRALFKLSLSRASADEATGYWKKLPRHVQSDPEVILIYTDALVRHQQHKEAEKLLHHAINENWHPKLIRQYAKVHSPKPAKQLAYAEAWLRRYPEDVNLLLTLGQLCLHNQLWGKAQRYFETALVKESSVEVYNDLGQVYEELGYQDKAMDCFRKGLALAVDVNLQAAY